MKIIVGLGNPGEKYQDTRHNIGFMVLDKLAQDLGDNDTTWQQDEKRDALYVKVGGVLLVKPQTFMNASGKSVAALMKYYKCDPADVWVVHDDMDLPIGKIRIREQGASGGHNGVDSIITALATDEFVRFRLGIGRGKNDTVKHTDRQLRHRSVINFVLSHFTDHEAGEMRKLVKYGVEAIKISLLDGLDVAMNRFN